MGKRICIAFIIGTFCIGSVSAQGIGVGPILGYQKASDADDGRLMFGAALRLKLSPGLGVEGSINYRQEKYADGLLTVKSWPVMASALLYPLPNVYGALGAGWYNTTFQYDRDQLPMLGNKTKQEFGWHLGGGLELPFSSTSKITGDIRYVFIDYDIEELVEFNGVQNNFYVITVGLLIGI
jgi:opacity protein-like surface antigen